MEINKRLQVILMQNYGIYVDIHEIGLESLELYADEMDENIIPSGFLKEVSKPICVDMANYTSENNYVLLQLKLTFRLEILLLNDEVVYRKLA